MGSISSSRPLSVAIICGGGGTQRGASLANGRAIALALAQAGHRPALINTGEMAFEAVEWTGYDIAWFTVHAVTGDGDCWQSRLENLGVPHTGSSAEACQAAASRSMARQYFLRFDVPTPAYVLLRRGVSIHDALARVASLGYPLILQGDVPAGDDRKQIVRHADELRDALTAWFAGAAVGRDDRVLCERLLSGRAYAVTLRGERVLPPVALDGEAAALSSNDRHVLEQVAQLASLALGTSGIVRVDVVLDKAGRPIVLDVNPFPSLVEQSVAARAAAAVGLTTVDLCQWMVHDSLVLESLR